MCNYIASLGIEVHRGKKITEYLETETEAGIIIDGQHISVDCVLACDGVNSKARGVIIEDVESPHPTGYAAYRACFNASTMKTDPKMQ